MHQLKGLDQHMCGTFARLRSCRYVHLAAIRQKHNDTTAPFVAQDVSGTHRDTQRPTKILESTVGTLRSGTTPHLAPRALISVGGRENLAAVGGQSVLAGESVLNSLFHAAAVQGGKLAS